MAFNFGSSAPAPGGFSFGSTPASTSATPAPAFSFGAKTTAPVAPQTGFNFGAAPAASTTTPAFSGFSLGGTAAPAPAATSATAAFTLGGATGLSSGGGFNFGGTAPSAASVPAPTFTLGIGSASALASAPTSSAPAPTSSAPVPSFSFGAAAQPATASFSLPAKSTSVASVPSTSSGLTLGSALGSSTAQTSAAPTFPFGTAATSVAAAPIATTSAAVLPNLSFGTAASVSSTLSAVATTAPLGTSGFGFKSGTGATAVSSAAQLTKASSTASGLVGSVTSVTAPAKQMSYKELEETVDKWLHELGEQEKAFLAQATQVNTWDKQLIHNGEKVTELNNEVEKVKADQQRLDRELDFILSQQEELEELLTPIEAQVKTHQLVQHVQHSDVERERTYNLADNIDAQLKRMMEDLREIIERINNSNVNPNPVDETMAHIGKILNSHMDSLQWIDQNTNQLQKRMEDVNHLMESRRLDSDRTFHLSYDRD